MAFTKAQKSETPDFQVIKTTVETTTHQCGRISTTKADTYVFRCSDKTMSIKVAEWLATLGKDAK